MTTCTARDCVDALSHIPDFRVFPSCSHAVILRWNFLSAADAVIDYQRFLLVLFETVEPASVYPSSLKPAYEEDASLPIYVSVFQSVRASEYIDTDE